MTTKPFSPQTKAMAHTRLSLIKGRGALLLFLGLSWLVTGCPQTVRLPERFPTPVTEKLPLRIGLYQDRPFRDYVYRREPEAAKGWIVDMRPIHKTLFQTLLGPLVSELIEIERFPRIPRQAPKLDAIIEPEVQAFELQTPSASTSPFCRVSVTYLLRVYSPQGRLLASWPVEGQGQGRSGWLQAAQGVTEAVTNALRDLGAQIVVELGGRPTISALLADKRAKNAGTPDPTTEKR
jgi:hypothetical protein